MKRVSRGGSFPSRVAGGFGFLLLIATPGSAQRALPGLVERTLGGALPLAPGDSFGTSVAPLGDFDGNGVPDLIVTAGGDDDGGAVWLLLLGRRGNVLGTRKISATEGGFGGDLQACGCSFWSADRIGDVDGDGVTDLVVGAPDRAQTAPGDAWVLFLDADGTVRDELRIGAGSGGFSGTPEEYFGLSVTELGDLDDDGTPDVAVGGAQGAWLLFLDPDGSVRDQRQLAPGVNGFPASTYPLALFGQALDGLGDFDADGIEDLVVSGQEWLFEGQIGHVFIVLLNADGTVKARHDLSSNGLGIWPTGFCPVWYGDNSFGWSVAALGDVDSDGVVDLGVGAPRTTCCDDAGGVWVLRMNADGSVRSRREITLDSAPYHLALHPLDSFGHGVASPGDVDGDGRIELAVGAPDSRGVPDCDVSGVADPLGSVRLLFQVR